MKNNNRKWKITLLCFSLIIITIVIIVTINSLTIRNNLNVTVIYGNKIIRLNDKVSDIDIDFSTVETTNINDLTDYEIVAYKNIDSLQIRKNYNWSLESSLYTTEPYIFIQGINKNDEIINVKDCKVEYIKVKINSKYIEKTDISVKIFNNLILGKSDKKAVEKFIKRVGKYDDLLISEKLKELYVKFPNNQYVKFIFDGGILMEVILSTYNQVL